MDYQPALNRSIRCFFAFTFAFTSTQLKTQSPSQICNMPEYHPLTHLKRPKCEGLAFTAKNRLHGAKAVQQRLRRRL